MSHIFYLYPLWILNTQKILDKALLDKVVDTDISTSIYIRI